MSGVDEHALWHSDGTPRRAAAATAKAAGDAVLCGKKQWGRRPPACAIMASRKSVIGVASTSTLGVSFLNLHGPALRRGVAASKSPEMRKRIAGPPDESVRMADSPRQFTGQNLSRQCFPQAPPGGGNAELARAPFGMKPSWNSHMVGA
jgi:hypothetical protein